MHVILLTDVSDYLSQEFSPPNWITLSVTNTAPASIRRGVSDEVVGLSIQVCILHIMHFLQKRIIGSSNHEAVGYHELIVVVRELVTRSHSHAPI